MAVAQGEARLPASAFGGFISGHSGTARKTGDWERVRLQLLQVLEGDKNWPELLAIALGEASGAMELYSRITPWLRWKYRNNPAQLAEKDFPAEALY